MRKSSIMHILILLFILLAGVLEINKADSIFIYITLVFLLIPAIFYYYFYKKEDV